MQTRNKNPSMEKKKRRLVLDVVAVFSTTQTERFGFARCTKYSICHSDIILKTFSFSLPCKLNKLPSHFLKCTKKSLLNLRVIVMVAILTRIHFKIFLDCSCNKDCCVWQILCCLFHFKQQ